jgi:hypothetical protein
MRKLKGNAASLCVKFDRQEFGGVLESQFGNLMKFFKRWSSLKVAGWRGEKLCGLPSAPPLNRSLAFP